MTTFFGGSAPDTVAALFENEKLSEDDLIRIEAIINEAKRQEDNMFIQCVLDCLLKVSVLLGSVTLVDLAWRQASADLSHRLWRWTCVIALILPLGSLMHPQHRLQSFLET